MRKFKEKLIRYYIVADIHKLARKPIFQNITIAQKARKTIHYWLDQSCDMSLFHLLVKYIVFFQNVDLCCCHNNILDVSLFVKDLILSYYMWSKLARLHLGQLQVKCKERNPPGLTRLVFAHFSLKVEFF